MQATFHLPITAAGRGSTPFPATQAHAPDARAFLSMMELAHGDSLPMPEVDGAEVTVDAADITTDPEGKLTEGDTKTPEAPLGESSHVLPRDSRRRVAVEGRRSTLETDKTGVIVAEAGPLAQVSRPAPLLGDGATETFRQASPDTERPNGLGISHLGEAEPTRGTPVARGAPSEGGAVARVPTLEHGPPPARQGGGTISPEAKAQEGLFVARESPAKSGKNDGFHATRAADAFQAPALGTVMQQAAPTREDRANRARLAAIAEPAPRPSRSEKSESPTPRGRSGPYSAITATEHATTLARPAAPAGPIPAQPAPLLEDRLEPGHQAALPTGSIEGGRVVHASAGPTAPQVPAPSASVPQQIATTLHATGPGSTEVRLEPAELGKVRLTLSEAEGGAMTVVISAERPETMDLLRRHVGALSAELRQLGYGDVSYEFDGSGNGSSTQTHPETDDESLADLPDEGPRAAPSPVTGPDNGGLDLRL